MTLKTPKTQMLPRAVTFTGPIALTKSEASLPGEGCNSVILSFRVRRSEQPGHVLVYIRATLCYAVEPAASQDVSKTRLNTGGVGAECGVNV